MGVSTYDGTLADNPWVGIDKNQRKFYDPTLRDMFKANTVYSKFTSYEFDTRGLPDTNSMEVTSLIMPHANFDPIGFRQLFMNASRIDSAARTVSIKRYAAKMAFHAHDRLITYWRGAGALDQVRAITARGLGDMMTEIHENLTRNAFLSSPYAMYGQGITGSANFANIQGFQDRLSTSLVRDIQLGLQYRNVPFTQRGSDSKPGQLVCITTPGVIMDLQSEASASGNGAAFVDIMKYEHSDRIVGDMGSYANVRFIANPRALLYNCGPFSEQKTITASHAAGDGSDPAEKVDGVYSVGQTTVGIKHYVQLNSVSGLAVDDIISFHIGRTSDFGVVNGADYREGTKQDIRIIKIDGGNNRVVLEKPLMIDYNVDLGGGVYGYATKGLHVHTSTFIGGIDGVVNAVHQPPRLYAPPPTDDFESIYRFSFDQRSGYHVWEPKVFEVHFGSGSFRYRGPALRN